MLDVHVGRKQGKQEFKAVQGKGDATNPEHGYGHYHQKQEQP